jgi:hypothetical protein
MPPDPEGDSPARSSSGSSSTLDIGTVNILNFLVVHTDSIIFQRTDVEKLGSPGWRNPMLLQGMAQ